jgi:cytochrome P450
MLTFETLNIQTVNTLMMFFIAMILFPDVQKKAQEELDRVIGTTRFPNVADRDQLDYVGRVVQEVFRWGPVTPIGEFADDGSTPRLNNLDQMTCSFSTYCI